MSDSGDQAAGLRRLFGGRHLRVVSFLSASPGVGRTRCVVELGAALAAQGRQVLVIDENGGDAGVARAFGIQGPVDLYDVITGRCGIDAALHTLRRGLRVLPAAVAAGMLDQISAQQREALFASVAGLAVPPDVVLVDTRLDHPLGLSPFALAAGETVVVLTAQPSSITAAYALIKRVSQRYGRRRFRVLINRAKALPDAEQVYANLARVSGQRELAALDLAAAIPQDAAIPRAERQSRPVTETFPEAPAAAAFRQFAADLLYWPCDADPDGFEGLMRQLLHLSRHITTPRAAATP